MPDVEQDTVDEEEEEEYDQPVVFYSGFCEFLDMEHYKWQSQEKAPFGCCVTPRAPRSSSSSRTSICWRTTTSLDSCFDLVRADGPGGCAPPSMLVGQATSAMRCGSRRLSLLAGFMKSGTPHDVSSILSGSWLFLRPFTVEWLRFPGVPCGSVLLLLFVGLKRTWDATFLFSTTGPGCSSSWPACTCEKAAPIVVSGVACTRWVLLVLHLALYYFFLPSGQDARHLGRYGTEGLYAASLRPRSSYF